MIAPTMINVTGTRMRNIDLYHNLNMYICSVENEDNEYGGGWWGWSPWNRTHFNFSVCKKDHKMRENSRLISNIYVFVVWKMLRFLKTPQIRHWYFQIYLQSESLVNRLINKTAMYSLGATIFKASLTEIILIAIHLLSSAL